jgi:hypothetical protein
VLNKQKGIVMTYIGINDDVHVKPSKIVGYLIVKSHGSDVFVEKVNKSLKEGWQPLGSAFVQNSEFVQTMVQYQESTYQSTGPK